MYCLDDESFERMSEEKDIECKRWISPNFHIRNHFRVSSKGWDALMWNKMEATHQLLTARIQCSLCRYRHQLFKKSIIRP